MITGLFAGILWALDTVILGIALSSTNFTSTEHIIFLAPFISTFFHDFFSSVWMFLYMGIKREHKAVLHALKTKGGKAIIFAALLGGPIGMSAYVAAIYYVGPVYTTIISSLFPALGAFFSYIFLKEKMRPTQLIALFISILGIILLGISPNEQLITKNFALGFFCAILCCIGWALEAVICAYGLKSSSITDEQALSIRQTVSALFYGIIILTVTRAWSDTISIAPSFVTVIIIISALFGTLSYLCYYRAIQKIGASKAMALDVTYSAWSIVFCMILLGQIPSIKDVICGIVIVLGSLYAATERQPK